ncbi:YdcF family protein [Sneathiella glossodoripedis]|uniref:YdcF family protein n=1 Tax=Sneathiella glossodoripedis TaxID=418853 RepID=UPI00046F48C8|nr:YdcF family protein [Sneathiella glossodoripedis]
MRSGASILIRMVIAVILLWLGGFLGYVEEIKDPEYSSVQSADGIVVLTGTPARLKLGLDLLKTGAAQRVLISGVNSEISAETLRQAMGESTKIMDCCVDLGRIAKDTVGNAYETSLWASENNFSSLIVVTSAYHMPRSLVELKRQMPNKTLYAHAAINDVLELDGWWRKPATAFILASEFNKYLISLIRANLERVAMAGDTQ